MRKFPALIFLTASSVFAQDPEAVAQRMSLGEIIETGGWLMYVLGAMSVIGLAMIIYFFMVLREERVCPRRFLDELYAELKQRRLDRAAELCRREDHAAASVALAGLEHMDSSREMEPVLLKEIMEGEGSRQASLLQGQIQYLLDLGVISPMVGLLGTVMGMLRAFNAVALDIAKAKPMILAAGVSQALITTAAGLLVGIPAMIFYSYFRGRSSKLISNLEAASADILGELLEAENAPAEKSSAL
ncbi:MAG: MotA/TolQ/ExbB proton channel family protein [Kiritimatiellia bacterium]